MDNLYSFSLILASAIAVIYLAHVKTMMAIVPQSVPWAGLGNEVFSKTRANMRELTAGLRTLKIGYNQVFKSLLLILTLLTTSICSSTERVSLGCSRILDFIPLSWCLKSISIGWLSSPTMYYRLVEHRYVPVQDFNSFRFWSLLLDMMIYGTARPVTKFDPCA